MDWKSVYDMYPVNGNAIWLNNCGTVPAGDHILQRVCGYLEGYSQKGVFTETEKTRAVSLSAVHWCTGMPLPLERIGKLCREMEIEFGVDGAQGVGMRPMDVKAANISFMAFSAWKWLMGPLGLGVLYVEKDKLEKLKPRIVGTGSVVRDEEYLPYKTTLKPSADRFTISTPNFTDRVYFLPEPVGSSG